MLGVKRNHVTLTSFNDEWSAQYQITKNELLNILSDNVIEIHHVGSTAIKGIVAKPILDVAVVIKNEKSLNFDGMESADYEYCGECGVIGRHLFVRRVNGDISTHHIHCYLENNENYNQVILFCKFLNEHTEYAKQYSEMKIKLASNHSDDRVAYTDGKENFIIQIIKKAKNEYQTE